MGSTPTDYRFTGQRLEVEVGLYFYQSRWYDPALGRFTQADTIIPEPGNPLALDRYAYVNNNPLKYIDPNGHDPCTPDGECGPYDYDPEPDQPIMFELDMTEKELLGYQQDQGDTSFCTSYALSTGYNLLTGSNTTGKDVINALGRWNLRHSWLPSGGAMLPKQGKRVVNELSDVILGDRGNLLSAETMDLTFEEMITIIEDPNQVALFTYNTTPGKVTSGHTVVLAGYNPNTDEFGFLNSGFERSKKCLHGRNDLKLKVISKIL